MDSFLERYILIEKKSIELVIVHTRSDWVNEYTMFSWLKNKSPTYMSDEWKKNFK
jgi:hypothetical protein